MIAERLCLVVESGTDVRLVEGLAERYTLTILARQIPGGSAVNHPPRMPVHIVEGPCARLGFARLVAAYLWRQRRHIDGVIVQGYGPAALSANLMSRLTGTPTAMLVCSPVEAYYRCRQDHPEPGKPFRRWELWGLQALARLNAVVGRRYLVLSNYLAGVVRSHGTRRPIDVIPLYGVDTTVFRPSDEPKAVIRARLGLPLTGALLFFSSRIAPEKDGETLLRAAQRLLATGRDLWLLHRSGGWRTFRQKAEEYGMVDRVIATDAVHPLRQLPQDYQACDLCVQASREEGLGFSPLEALACGVPVVTAAVGGMKETIVDGQTGWTYPVGDSAALARCIAGALDDPAEAARRTAAGRALVAARYDRGVVFDQLAAVLPFKADRLRSELGSPKPEFIRCEL